MDAHGGDSMLTRWWEIICDGCGGAEHFQGNKREAEGQARDVGWIITREKKHYCSEKCKDGGRAHAEAAAVHQSRESDESGLSG